MFNYLEKAEETFFENRKNIQKNNYFDQNFLTTKLFYLEQLFVPFSENSFKNDNFNLFLTNMQADFLFIFINFIALGIHINCLITSGPIRFDSFIALELLSPLLITWGAIDLAFNLSVFLLSLVTRSIASLVYMLDYSLNPPTEYSTQEHRYNS